MIGLKKGTVRLTRYSAIWRQRYAREHKRLARRLGKRRYTLEHIGSTAVPGLDAKPIIDMALQIPSLKQLPLWIRRLQDAGYAYQGEYGLPGRHFFTRGTPVTHHLHLVARDCAHWDRWLLFRDYLRAKPEVAARYNAFKRDLAKQFARNRDAYTQAKTPFINRLLAAARRWRKTL